MEALRFQCCSDAVIAAKLCSAEDWFRVTGQPDNGGSTARDAAKWIWRLNRLWGSKLHPYFTKMHGDDLAPSPLLQLNVGHPLGGRMSGSE
jgi:hypothetical protein